MAKRCPTCGHTNDDSRIFCGACGDPLDADLRLIQDLQKQKHQVEEKAEHKRYHDEDEDVPVMKQQTKKQEKKSALPIILVALVIIVAAAWFFLK